jgi:type VI secretion system protein ImpE
MNASELYQAGKLGDAVQAALEEVRTKPTDVPRRFFLCELLCFAGDFERADKQLEVIGQQSTDAVLRVSLFRHLVRAELARQQFFREGRMPEFLGDPPPALRGQLEASIAWREGRMEAAAELLAAAEAQRPVVSGTCDGVAFRGFRDLDDLLSGCLEVLTSTGKYYWVPIERVELLEFVAPARPMDLIWREAHLVVAGGPDGVVYLPTTYVPLADSLDDQLRLGRGTDWTTDEAAPVRGRGLRMFLIGERDCTILELKQVQLEPSE